VVVSLAHPVVAQLYVETDPGGPSAGVAPCVSIGNRDENPQQNLP
jgi:hypothetical protein